MKNPVVRDLTTGKPFPAKRVPRGSLRPASDIALLLERHVKRGVKLGPAFVAACVETLLRRLLAR